MKSITLKLAIALLATTPLAAQAAAITHLSNTTVTSDSDLDSPLLLFPGATLAQAVTFGGSAQTVATTGGQSIAFALGAVGANQNMPAAPSTSTVVFNAGTQAATALFPGTTGDAQFDAVLRSGAWHNNGSDAAQPLTLRIGGLTSGETYLLSLFSADARSTDRSQAYWDTFSGGVFSGGTSGSFSQNPATMTMVTFTADAGFQDIFIQETDAVGNDDTNLAGFTLYVVPEPSAAILAGAGGIGLLGMFRRRRVAALN